VDNGAAQEYAYPPFLRVGEQGWLQTSIAVFRYIAVFRAEADLRWVNNTAFLPDNYLHFLARHVLNPRSPLQLLKAQAASVASGAGDMVFPVVKPLLDRVTLALWNSPDVVVLGTLLLALYLAVQLVFMAKRLVVWWTGVAVRILWYAALAALAAAVWQRGLEATLRDLFVLGGKLMGYAVVIKEIWVREYNRYNVPVNAPPPGAGQGAPSWRVDRAGGRTGLR